VYSPPIPINSRPDLPKTTDPEFAPLFSKESKDKMEEIKVTNEGPEWEETVFKKMKEFLENSRGEGQKNVTVLQVNLLYMFRLMFLLKNTLKSFYHVGQINVRNLFRQVSQMTSYLF
jgi:hypothetical protein